MAVRYLDERLRQQRHADDLHGVSYFFSLNNGYVSQWMAELGYNTPEEYNYVGLHGRSVMDALLGVKYFLTGTDATNTMPHGYDTQPVLAMDVAGVNVGAYPSGDALPIGYTSAARIAARLRGADPGPAAGCPVEWGIAGGGRRGKPGPRQ